MRVRSSEELAHVDAAFSPNVQPSAGKNNHAGLQSPQPILDPLPGALDTVSREAR
jgi:hypothetical protein